MIEKNREILKSALDGMPEHKAGNANWESISGALAEAEGEEFLSEHLSKLPEHHAPAGAWAGIAAGLKSPWYSFGSYGILKPAGLLLTATALITALVLLLPEEKEDEILPKGNTSHALLDAADNNEATPEKEKDMEPGPVNAATAGDKEYPLDVQNENFESPVQENSSHQRSVAEVIGRKAVTLTSSGKTLKNSSEKSSDFNSMDISSLNLLKPGIEISNEDLAFIAQRQQQSKSFNTDYYRSRGATDFGIAPFFSRISYQNVNVQNMEIPESVSSFGLEFIMDKPLYFLKTGVSYLSWEEKAKYTFEYRKNELIYSYNYVDSAFIKPVTGDIIYHTSERNVYDSVEHQRPDEIRYEYRVLQVPLIFGYKILNRDKISLSLNAGVAADLRVGGREYAPVFNEDNAELTAVSNYLDYRFKVNWRLMGGLGLYYAFSDQFSFYLEPSYQKYLRSVYQESKLRDVSYIELKTGILIKF